MIDMPDSENELSLKRCTKCGEEKPATTKFFHHHRNKLHAQCKECRRLESSTYQSRPEVQAQRQAYRDAHKEQKRIRDSQYRLRPDVQERIHLYNSRSDVRERRRAYHREYYHGHPEVKARQKAFHNRLEAQERKRAYYHHPDIQERERQRHKSYKRRPEIQEYMKTYNKTYRSNPQNQERMRAISRNRKARKKAVIGTHTVQQIQDLLKRQCYKCYYCHTKFQILKGRYIYHVEHTFPLIRVVGTDIPANSIDYLVLACPKCNLSKGNKYPWEWPEGGRLL